MYANLDFVFWAGVIVGLICGAVPLIVGATKNELGQGLAGLLLCGVAGIIGGLIAAVPVAGICVWVIISSNNKKQIAQSRKCPYCAELILVEAKVCKHCGRDVEPERQSQSDDLYSGEKQNHVFFFVIGAICLIGSGFMFIVWRGFPTWESFIASVFFLAIGLGSIVKATNEP